jgi:hypothetical protein
MKWIKCSEKMPTKNDEYITCGKGFDGLIVTTLEYKQSKWWSDVFQQFVDSKKIIYWMPLPKPPQNKSLNTKP